MRFCITCVLLVFVAAAPLAFHAQNGDSKSRDFRSLIAKRIKSELRSDLASVCPVDTDLAARTIFADYGAVFVASGVSIPWKCIFDDDAEVQAYHGALNTRTETIGGTRVTLQNAAMEALLVARKEALARGLNITPRGGSLAATRSYADSVRLWKSRFEPGLNHWVAKRRITAKEADAARKMSIRDQVTQVLTWEQDSIWFSRDLSKSILYSVAAPGASQHIFGLAFDVTQFANKDVRDILSRYGWFQTVKSDLPHFTYLGREESELPGLRLRSVTFSGQKFWIPDIEY
jgi:hypothetical protein